MSTDENVLAGARQFTRLGSVLEAVAQRIQQQFSVLLADQPGEQNADARSVTTVIALTMAVCCPVYVFT